MKSLLLVPLVLFTVSAEPLSKSERDKAMSQLHASRKMFVDALTPLSDTQLHFKPAPEKWSVGEVAEHLAESEQFLRAIVERGVTTINPDPAKRNSRKANDEERAEGMLGAMRDRSQKANAPAELKPTGKYKTKDEVLAAFTKRRDETLKFVETTKDDLRGRFVAMGPTESDLYEMLLFISAHTERHMEQMKEVMADAKFPKS